MSYIPETPFRVTPDGKLVYNLKQDGWDRGEPHQMNSPNHKIGPDVFSYHEAMDRANQVSEILSAMFDGHSVVEYEPEVKDAYDKAAIALNHLYNVTAEASFSKYPDTLNLDEDKIMYNREETDTRYANGMACMYANLVSVITGHPADQFIKACQMFVDHTAKYHESVRNNFVPADGFFSQIMKMQEVLTD